MKDYSKLTDQALQDERADCPACNEIAREQARREAVAKAQAETNVDAPHPSAYGNTMTIEQRNKLREIVGVKSNTTMTPEARARLREVDTRRRTTNQLGTYGFAPADAYDLPPVTDPKEQEAYAKAKAEILGTLERPHTNKIAGLEILQKLNRQEAAKDNSAFVVGYVDGLRAENEEAARIAWAWKAEADKQKDKADRALQAARDAVALAQTLLGERNEAQSAVLLREAEREWALKHLDSARAELEQRDEMDATASTTFNPERVLIVAFLTLGIVLAGLLLAARLLHP